MHRALAVATSFVTLLGCGPSSNTSDAGRTEQLSESFASVICAKNLQCCTSPEATLELCQSGVNGYFERLRKSNDPERESFDSGLADACLRDLDVLTCSEWVAVVEGAPPASCRGFARGRIANGQRCAGDLECRSHFCNGNTSLCEARLGQDAPCDGLNNQCAPGMSCGDGSLPGAFCGSPRAEGSACSAGTGCYSFVCTAKACGPSCWYDPDRYDMF